MMLRNFIFPLAFFIAAGSLAAQDLYYTEKKELKGFPEYILQAGFSPYRNFFALTVGNNTLELYDKNWKKIFTHQGNPASLGGFFCFSPDESFLAFAKYKSKNDVAILDLTSLKITQVLQGHSSHINDLCISNDSKFLVTCADDDLTLVWERKSQNFELLTTLTDTKEPVNGASFSYDDKFLALAGNDRKLFIYEWKNGKPVLFQVAPNDRSYVSDVVFHPRKMELITGSSYGIKLWKWNKKEFVKADTTGDDVDVNGPIHFSPTGEYIALGAYNSVVLYRLATGKIEEALSIYRHSDHVFSATFSNDGKYLTSYSSDKSAIVWDISGISPSDVSLVAGYLDNQLTLAQKKVLTPSNVSSILFKLDQNLAAPRDEFETSEEYTARRKKLKAQVLAGLQGLIEKNYQVVPGTKDGEIKIPLQELIGYNADVQVYKIRFLEEEAGVDIPVSEAKTLKQNRDKAWILATRINNAETGTEYTDFRLQHPISKKEYPVSISENPFRLKEESDLILPGNRQIQSIPDSPKQDTTAPGELSKKAVLFATNVYDAFQELVNPVNDATTLADELRSNYGMDVDLVLNPSLNETIGKIREFAELDYGENDQLLIFFAGHGIYDEVFKEGYIISRDSRSDDLAKTSYLSHSNLRTMVNNIPCKHTLLIMDVCFGGTFDPLLASGHRGADLYEGVSNEEFIQRKTKYQTRLYLTSGGKEYVPDGRPGQHSPFARKLLEALRTYGGQDNILTTAEILQFVEKVDPQPRFGEFGNNEPGSDFLLFAQ